MPEKKLFKIVVTAIIIKDGKFLIAKRSEKEEKFPGRWVVPGGGLHVSDYAKGKKDTPHYWYNVLENALRREVWEEVGIRIKNVRYVTSLADKPNGKDPSIVLSMMADWSLGKGRTSNEIVDFAWVNLKEVKKYDLIEGIYEELEQAEKLLKGERTVWKRKK
jgi:8-oxo-dGTP pyrophosphatase MutT (NUDIX family)